MLVPRNVFQYCRDFRIFPQIIKLQLLVELEGAETLGHLVKDPCAPMALQLRQDAKHTQSKSVRVVPWLSCGWDEPAV